MSTPPDIMGILNSGLMNYSQPNALNQGLMSGDPSMQLGIQLLANSSTPGKFPSILGKSLAGMQQQQQQNAQTQMQLLNQSIATQQAQQMWPLIMQGMQGLAGGQQGGPQGAPGQGQGGAAGGMAPQGAPQGGPPGMNMANLGAMLALAGRPGGQQLIDAAKLGMEYNPGLKTQMSAAGSEIAQDQALVQQGLQSRNMPLAQAAYMKFLKDAGQLNVSAMSGDVTTFGGITPQGLGMSNFNPARGTQTVGGMQTPIPGAAQTQQALAAAGAMGEAAGKPFEGVNPATGAKYLQPLSSALGAARGPMGSAGPTGTPGPLSALGPGQSEMFKGNASTALEANKAYQQQVEAGQQMLANTAELRHAAADFGSGRFAENRATMLDLLNSAGLITAQEKNQLGSAQVGQKIAIQLQAAATKQLGSREAAQIFSIMGKSLPNLTLSSDGLEKVSAYLDGVARYNIARGQLAQQRASQNDANGVNNVRNEFVQNTNPLYYIIASAAPAQQKEMIDSMGGRKMGFLQAWNQAANQGWAPRPGQYNAGP